MYSLTTIHSTVSTCLVKNIPITFLMLLFIKNAGLIIVNLITIRAPIFVCFVYLK